MNDIFSSFKTKFTVEHVSFLKELSHAKLQLKPFKSSFDALQDLKMNIVKNGQLTGQKKTLHFSKEAELFYVEEDHKFKLHFQPFVKDDKSVSYPKLTTPNLRVGSRLTNMQKDAEEKDIYGILTTNIHGSSFGKKKGKRSFFLPIIAPLRIFPDKLSPFANTVEELLDKKVTFWATSKHQGQKSLFGYVVASKDSPTPAQHERAISASPPNLPKDAVGYMSIDALSLYEWCYKEYLRFCHHQGGINDLRYKIEEIDGYDEKYKFEKVDNKKIDRLDISLVITPTSFDEKSINVGVSSSGRMRGTWTCKLECQNKENKKYFTPVLNLQPSKITHIKDGHKYISVEDFQQFIRNSTSFNDFLLGTVTPAGFTIFDHFEIQNGRFYFFYKLDN